MSLVFLDTSEAELLCFLLEEDKPHEEVELQQHTNSVDNLIKQKGVEVYWKEGITFDQKGTIFGSKRDFNIVLVDPMLGIIKQGKNVVNEAELLKNPKYIELTTQAKFYNGVLNHYTIEEQNTLNNGLPNKVQTI